MKEKIKSIVLNPKFIVFIFILLATVASLQSLLSGTKTHLDGGIKYNHYNNYTISEKSFHHLKEGKDLYILYPKEHWDLYKYTPSFAAFFGIFAIFPDWIGLNFWNLFNAFILLLSIYYLPKLSIHQKGLILILISIELMTSLQNAQSNGLVLGLLILAFGLLEKDKYLFATLCILFSVFIKLFGIIGFALFLFYPKKWKLALYSGLWSILLLAMPLVFISIDQYGMLLSSYGNMLTNDHTISYGYSVMGWLNSWFGIELNKFFIVGIGILIFSIPLLKFKEYKNFDFRLLALTSILIWVVIFNHKAESPTFIIAMGGAALWFIANEKNKINLLLFLVAFILTSLSPTEIFPRFLRDEFVKPYNLKVFPCILVWLKIIYDMIVFKKDPDLIQEEKAIQ